MDGKKVLDTQVNNLNGVFGTIFTVTGILDVPPGNHTFDQRCYTNASAIRSITERSPLWISDKVLHLIEPMPRFCYAKDEDEMLMEPV